MSGSERPSAPRLLVLGARGFVGGHLKRCAKSRGVDAITAARGPGADLECDLLDGDSIRSCLREARPDAVVNAAGSASVAASFEDPEGTRAVNADGAVRLLDAVAAASPGTHVLLLSSAQVYGEAGEDELPFAEDSPARPITPYGEAKAEMERAALERAAEGAPIAVARLFNQLGPGLPETQGVSGFAHRIAAAEQLGEDSVALALANPDAARDFTDVRDTAGALLELSERRATGVFNVCSGSPVGMRSLIDLLGGQTSLEVEVDHDGEARRGREPTVSYGDPARLEAIGWRRTIELEDSLADLLGWWRERLAGTSPERPQ